MLRLCDHVADLERQALAAAVDAVVCRVQEEGGDAGLIAAREVHRRARSQAPPHLRCHVLQVVRARVEAVHEHVQVRWPQGVRRHGPKCVLPVSRLPSLYHSTIEFFYQTKNEHESDQKKNEHESDPKAI